MKLTQVAGLLELHANGEPRTHHERYALPGVAHSRMCDLEAAGYVFEKWQLQREGEALHMTRLVAVPPAASRYEVQLERAGAWGAAEELRRMRSAGRVSRQEDTQGSPTSHRQVGPVAAAAEVTVGGSLGAGAAARSSSRPGVERDNESAPPLLVGASGGAVVSTAAAPPVPSVEAGAPPGAIHVLPEVLQCELGGVEDELAALAADADALPPEDVERLEELEARRDEILAMGRAA